MVFVLKTNIRKYKTERDVVDKMAKVAKWQRLQSCKGCKVEILQFIFFRAFRTLPFDKLLVGRNFP